MCVILTITSGPAAGKVLKFTEPDTLLFGRASDAHVQMLGDKMVSRNHFSLLISERECRVRDLGSSNGTYVANRSGKFLRYGGTTPLPRGAVTAPDASLECALLDGDSISVGETKLTVKIERPEDKTIVQDAAPDDTDKTIQQPSSPTALTEVISATAEVPTMVSSPVAVIPVDKSPGKLFLEALQFPGFELLDKIGEGGMGVVVKARRVADGRIVAIKTMISPKGPNAARMMDAFEREIRVHAGLKHPHIVEQLDVMRAGSVLGVVLEFVDGMDLARYTKGFGGKVPLADAAPLLLEALSGLAHAHAAGVVHRDLKPENIFLAKNGARWTAKVADFGLAKSYEASGKSLFEIAGTPPFWPREHITAYQSLYPASDVFSIAALFYWMLAGIHARDGMSEMLDKNAALKRRPGFGDYTQVITTGRIVPLRQSLPELPEAVSKVFDRALHEEELTHAIQSDKNALRGKLAEMRFPNAGAFKDALAMALKMV